MDFDELKTKKLIIMYMCELNYSAIIYNKRSSGSAPELLSSDLIMQMFKSACNGKDLKTYVCDKFIEQCYVINNSNDVFLRHRIDGPAVIYHSSEDAEWWVNGLLHRVDGPAIYYPSLNYEEYSFNGEKINQEQVLNSPDFTEEAKKHLIFNLDRAKIN